MQLFNTLYDYLPGYPCVWSPDLQKSHRYTLWRVWAANPIKIFMVIGLNPSTADEIDNDPTIRRCIGFAKREGCDAMLMCNAFAFRATDPAVMKAATNPVGDENDAWLQRCAGIASVVVAAWGVHGEFMGRGELVKNMIPGLMCFGTTKGGHPKHPLYLAANTPLKMF